MTSGDTLQHKNFKKRAGLSFLLLSLLCSGGCTSQPAASPEAAVDNYVAAVREGRLEDAYKMLSRESRADLSFAAFTKLVKANPKEIEALLEGLKQQEAPPMVRAEVTAKNGEQLNLVYEDGAWRIDESAIDLYSQSEPRTALRSFVRAFDNKRYDVLLEFVPDEQKEGLSARVLKESWEGEQQLEMAQIVEALRAHLESAQLEVLGERATMSYGAGAAIELIRERGAWKIEDFQ